MGFLSTTGICPLCGSEYWVGTRLDRASRRAILPVTKIVCLSCGYTYHLDRLDLGMIFSWIPLFFIFIFTVSGNAYSLICISEIVFLVFLLALPFLVAAIAYRTQSFKSMVDRLIVEFTETILRHGGQTSGWSGDSISDRDLLLKRYNDCLKRNCRPPKVQRKKVSGP